MFPWKDLFDFLPLFIIFPIFYLAFRELLDFKMRKNLIEKGMSAEDAKVLLKSTIRTQSPSSLKWGLVLTLLGISFLAMKLFDNISSEAAVGVWLLSAGLGLLIYYFIAMTKLNGNDKK